MNMSRLAFFADIEILISKRNHKEYISISMKQHNIINDDGIP